MQTRIISEADLPALSAQWETLVASQPASGFMQSLAWSRFKRSQKLTPVHIGIFEGGVLAGGGIFYTAGTSKGAGMMVAPDGPVLPWHDEEKSRMALRLVVQAAESYARQNSQIAIRIQPRLQAPAFVNEYEFGRAPVDITPRETLFIDLRLDEPTLLAQMKPKTRYNLSVADRHGVNVFENYESSASATFHQTLLAAASRNGFYVEPRTFFDALVETLAPSGMLRLFFAEHEGEILGGLLMIVYGNRATYLYGGISNHKRHVMAGYALQWAAMRAAKAAGATEYDFYGFDEIGSPSNSYAQFSRFKRGFGGSAVRYIGAQDYFFLDNLADAVIRAISEVEWDATEVSRSERTTVHY